jgi:cell division protein FtsA
MAQRIYTGIDIGTSHIKVMVAAPSESPGAPMQVLGTGIATARGLRHGYVVDAVEATRSVREALARAKAAAKTPITAARIAIGGVGLEEVRSSADITLTASGGVVTPRDVERALRESEKRASGKLVNRSVIHTIPLEFRIDGNKVHGKPTGMQGTKLAVDTLIISILTQHYEDLLEIIDGAGIEVEGVIASPLAAALVALSKQQRTAGVCLANIGAETVSLIVYDDDIPVSIKVLSSGSADVTNAIALSFQIPMSEAESLKRGGVIGSEVPVRKLETLVTGQLKDLFTTINTHLKSIGRARLLPAGIVLIGGGASAQNAAEIARTILKLPAAVGVLGGGARSASSDASWAVAYGLCQWAYREDSAERRTTLSEVLRNASDSVKKTFRSLLP